MKIGYVVSMFPCWSETFILNELVEHKNNNVDLYIFSLKKKSEYMIHAEALPFLANTIYPLHFFNPLLWILHLQLAISKPDKYFSILKFLWKAEYNEPAVKIKSLAVFLLSPLFVKNVKKNDIDHLHAHFATYPALLAWILSSFGEVSFSVTAHAHDIYMNQDILKLIHKRASKVFTISKFNKEFLSRKIGKEIVDKVEVLHCGINTARYSFDEKPLKRKIDRLQIVSIGRLSGIKGFPWLFEALKILQDEGHLFTCNIIGDGPLKNSLQEQVYNLGIEKEVSFLGSKKSDEIPAYLKSANVFVLACSMDNVEGHDGIPLVFMEAMALGVPVIGTQLSGIPELIRHNETGLCAKVNDPESIKENLVYIQEHPEKAEEMRHAARDIIENEFNILIISARLREFFETQLRKEN